MSLQLSDIDYSLGPARERQNNRLLQQVNLTIQQASINAVIGPNGAGKTTLLRVACGELRGSAGLVVLDGVVLADIPLEQRAKSIAFLTQQTALDFPFKGYEVIQMGRIPHLTGTRHDKKVIEEVVEACDLARLVDRTYTTLSGGEKQRIQIARILCQVWDNLESAYVLFDEPTAALDLSHQLVFFQLVQKLASKGAGIVLVLHDINLASRFADTVTLLALGRILAHGRPEEVISRANIRAAFSVEIDLVQNAGPPLIQARLPATQDKLNG